tara:strand:- start:1836 stop:2651 length:816 start_codon:yes stop_codon:yes gene_type:complete
MSATIITALYDINRDTKGDGRTFDEYLTWFKGTLKVKTPMVIFVDESLKGFVEENRKNLPTKIVTGPLEEVPYYYLNDRIQEVLDNPEYKNKIGAPDRVECKLSLYNVIIYSKFSWVKKVIEDNPFNSEYFMWMDAGLSRFFGPHEVDVTEPYPSNDAIEALVDSKESVLIQVQTSFYPDLVNKQVFTIEDLWDARSFVMAGLWGGGSESLSKFCDLIDDVLVNKMLKNNLVNNEQVAMAYVYKTNDDLFTVFENEAHLHRQYEIMSELQS